MSYMVRCPYCKLEIDCSSGVSDYIRSKISDSGIEPAVVPCPQCNKKFYLRFAISIAPDQHCSLNNEEHDFVQIMHSEYLNCIKCGIVVTNTEIDSVLNDIIQGD